MALYAFDGTWNSATLDDNVETTNETNVANFYVAYTGPKWYVSGPGTRFEKVGRMIGGVFGAGGPERLKEAYNTLCENWAAGDHVIDIIGFSRGAALALDFANRIEDNGIRRPGTKEVVEERPAIRFLGLWDVVGAFGVGINAGLLEFQKINFGHKLYIPDNVQYCFHAMAMDERRQTFRVTRLLNGYEVWFRGVHSDVGGGNGNLGLASIALCWMLRKATGAGLPIKETAIADHLGLIDPEAALHPPEDFIPNEYRGFLNGDHFHYTVKARPGHNNPPDGCVHETEANEASATPMDDLPARDASPNTSPIPGARVEVGQTKSMNVIAQKCWNTVGLVVKQGERYTITATGQWQDKEYQATAAGYASPNWFMQRFEHTRRVAQAPWFSLIAAVHPSHRLEFEQADTNMVTDFFVETLGHSIRNCDRQSQMVNVGAQGSIEVDRDGYLYLFANDTAWAYDNNIGAVNVTIERMQ
jgi:Uncharacterized alpha/beta hydrolase domain (DUF2235)